MSWKEKILKEGKEIFEDCGVFDWDGYEAEPVTEETLSDFKRLLDSIPDGVPEPSACPEPEGRIGLQWDYGDNMCLMSLDGTTLNFAVLIGDDTRIKGPREVDGFPKDIADILKKEFK